MTALLIATPLTSLAQEAESPGQEDALLWCSQDAVTPQFISHDVDAIYRGEQVEQIYNFIDYHFEQSGQYMRARTYIHEIEAVAVYGPYASAESLEPVENDAFKNAVLSYLKRRFFKIEELADEDFQVIWEWSEAEAPSLEQCEPIVSVENVP